MSSPLMFVRDGRTMPFVPVTKAALRAVRASAPKNLPIARSVYMALLELANEARADRARVTLREIGELSGASRASVQRAYQDLVQAGVLVVVPHAHAGGRAENEYVLVEPESAQSAPEAQVQNIAPPSLTDTPPSPTDTPPVSHRGGVLLEEGRREREDAHAVEPAGLDNTPSAVVCSRVAALREAFDPRASPTAAGWEHAAEQLLADRQLPEVLQVIAWVAADPFWGPRVLSPADLAKHFTRILALQQSARDEAAAPPTTKHGKELAARRQRTSELEAIAGSCCAGDTPPSRAEEEWARLAPDLRSEVGDALWDVWLAGAHPHAGENDQLLVAVDEHIHDWVAERFGPAITRIAQRPVEFVVCQEATA